MSRVHLIRSVGTSGLALLALTIVTPSSTAAPERPNLLILVGDDHAADTLGSDGDPRGATPRLDRLASQGVSFTRAYCNAPVCTASRQSFITGRLPHAVGVTRLTTPLPESAVTLGDWLGDRGFATGAIGKMHFNSALKHGFAERVDAPDWEAHLRANPPPGGDRRRPWRPFKDPAAVWLNAEARPEGLPLASTEAHYFADKAAGFFDRHKDKADPFALVVSFHEPHSPFRFPDDWPRRYKAEDFPPLPVSEADRRALPKVFQGLTTDQARGIQAAYTSSVSFLDHEVGRVLDALDASGMADRTVVAYLGDHGYLRGHHGRFEKHCFYERAIRVPLILRWPGHLPGGRKVDAMAELVDLLPTLLDLAGQPMPPDLHGRSLAPLARGDAGAVGRPVVFAEYLENEEAMVRGDRFKLIVGTGRRKRLDGYETDDPTPGPYERLFDLKSDPEETVDLASRPEHAAAKEELFRALSDRLTTTRAADDPAPVDLGRIEAIHRMLRPRD